MAKANRKSVAMEVERAWRWKTNDEIQSMNNERHQKGDCDIEC